MHRNSDVATVSIAHYVMTSAYPLDIPAISG
jgi:hypothetical protein